jgi:multiple sugar transport system permease protein
MAASESTTGRQTVSPSISESVRVKRRIGTGATYATLVILSVVFMFPLVWLVSTSLKPDQELIVWPPRIIPETVMWANYPDAWTMHPFNIYLRNTVIITGLAGVGQVFSASVVAYGFARLRFPGRDFLFGVVVSTLMLPYIVTLVPLYVIFKRLGWVDTFLPLIVPAYFGGGPLYIFLLRQFFRSIPADLSDVAKIDGASDMGIFLRVMLPLAKPGIAAAAVFSFMFTWNDFMGPLIYLNSQSKRTLTLGLRDFISVAAQETHYQYLMAVSAITIVPVMITFFVAQKYFIQGVVLSGIKG